MKTQFRQSNFLKKKKTSKKKKHGYYKIQEKVRFKNENSIQTVEFFKKKKTSKKKNTDIIKYRKK